MSYLMDYGLDELPEPPKRRWPLWRVAAAWTAVYLAIAVAGLIAISVMHTSWTRLTPVSDSPAPHPATPRRTPEPPSTSHHRHT